jgi:uncharacterized protein YkwD
MKKLLIILLLPLSVFSQSRKSQIDSAVVIMHQLVNEYRIENRLDTLELSDDLTKKAQAHAEWMYYNKYEHSLTAKQEGLAENCLEAAPYDFYFKMSTRHWVNADLNLWKNSPGHNSNLLEIRISKFGFGTYKGYSVQLFK